MPGAVAPFASDSRFTLLRGDISERDFGRDVRSGLGVTPKSLPPRWFYDQIGSSLFDAICFLPEYYVTRTETEILTANRDDIAKHLGSGIRLVELGSGMARKTRILLDVLAAGRELEYVPIDVDEAVLERSGRDLLAEYPALQVTAVRTDFTRPSTPLSMIGRHRGRTVVLFLGSTIGNLDPDEGVGMLRDLRTALAPGDALLLGADLRKPPEILEPAYNDSLGITASFNLNLLGRINRELGGNFQLDGFRHHAFYDEHLGRIEMHLVSTRPQRVRIEALALDVALAEGETIHTENSWKHDDSTIAWLAGESRFTVEKKWTDSRGWFADVLMIAS